MAKTVERERTNQRPVREKVDVVRGGPYSLLQEFDCLSLVISNKCK